MSDATYAGGPPPAGWYPDPDFPGQHRWWDGAQWHASLAPLRPLLGPAPALATALVWMIGFQAVANLILVGLYAWGHFHQPDDIAYSDTFTTYDVIDMAVGIPNGLVYFATIIVWCFWQHRLAAAAPRETLRRSPGMHVGSWFIPIVMLWFPLQNMRDLWAHYVGARILGLLGGWWTLWIVTNFTTKFMLQSAWDEERSARFVNDASLVDAALWPGLCALAIVIVVRLTRAARADEAARLAA